MKKRIVITGHGAICASGRSPEEIWNGVRAGHSSLTTVKSWDASAWPNSLAGEISSFNPNELVSDRKVQKLVSRSDLLGLYAAEKAIACSSLVERRSVLAGRELQDFNDKTGVLAAAGGPYYKNQYDFLPLLAKAEGSMEAFARELTSTVNPIWLLRTLPNNVVCHLGIRYGFKGTNGCITNHGLSSALAVGEAAEALLAGEAERMVVVANGAPIEPQACFYYQSLGLLAGDVVRPFGAGSSGTLLGEGAGAVVLELESAARPREAPVFGEFLGWSIAGEARGLLSIRDDGDGPSRAMAGALDSAGIGPSEIGLIIAHGNGNAKSDDSEARAIRRVFGDRPPPMTAFKWAFGHLLEAAAMVDLLLALISLQRGEVPGIATLDEARAETTGLSISREAQRPRGDIALIHTRGFGGLNVALIFRALPGGAA